MQQEHSSRSRRSSLLLVSALVVLTALAHLGSSSQATSTPSRSLLAFDARVDRQAVREGGDGLLRMELTLAAGKPTASATRVATDLVVILDRSGSMAGDKIAYARAAILTLIDELSAQDCFSLVTYAGDASVAIPLQAADSASRAAWRTAIAAVATGGGTNIARGLDVAFDAVAPGRSTRLVLISDGVANQGDSSLAGLSERATRAARAENVLTTVGVGDGFNESLLVALADAGTGNFYYLQNGDQLGALFADEFAASRNMVASGVTVTITPGEGTTVVDAAGYPLERLGRQTTFRPGSMFAGQERRIWVTYRVSTSGTGAVEVGTVEASWSEGGERMTRRVDPPAVACVRTEQEFVAAVDKEAWAASVVDDAYHSLEQEVARYVRDGDRQAARAAIGVYKEQTAGMNAVIQSPRVDENLAEVESLAREVDDAFTGDGQHMKQNSLSKSREASGWDGRRNGSKRR